MKKIFYFILTILIVSCSDTTTDDVSRVTNYPVMTLNGERTIVLNQGQTYTEEGAVSLAGTEELPVTITGPVNTAVPNVYKVTYTSVNVDGFAATLTRAVVVLSTAPSTIDLSGSFTRNGNVNKVTKLSDRKYICDNATGYNVAADKVTLEFYNVDDTKIYAPYQENTSESHISAESNVGTITDKNNWKWIIYASAVFGTAERIFTR